jgi:hypothetical protein
MRVTHPWNWTGFVICLLIVSSIVSSLVFFAGLSIAASVVGSEDCTSQPTDSGALTVHCTSPDWNLVRLATALTAPAGIVLGATAFEIRRLARRWNSLRFYAVVWTAWTAGLLAALASLVIVNPAIDELSLVCVGLTLTFGVSVRSLVLNRRLSSLGTAATE